MKKIILLLLVTIGCYNKVSAQQYTVNNNATKDNCHCYTLTKDINNQSGSVWNNNKIDLTQPFDFKFEVYLGCNDNDGADGIAFVLQPISTSVGGVGGGMGYSGVGTSVGVTLDDYQNTGDNDPVYDHIDIQYNGNVSHPITPPRISATADNVEDCKWHTLRIKWEPSISKLTVYFDDVERVNSVRNIVTDIFHGDPNVYWGFTGATGGSRNLQQFCTALKPALYFLPDQKKCVGEVVKFFDSTRSFGPVKSWLWDFGDGNTSTLQNPEHTYAVANDYTVKLNVEGADLCTEQLVQTVRIGSFPVADFTVSNTCANVAANFKDVSTVSVGTINKWTWDLGFNISSTQQNPAQSYNALVDGTNNNITATLTVSTLEGCASTQVQHPVTIYGVPTAKFTGTSACEGTASTFTDGSDFNGQNLPAINGTINKWQWDFGAGINSAQQNPSVTLTSANTNASLTVTSSNGCISQAITQPITTAPKPTSSFTIDATQKLCINNPVTFTDASLPSASIKTRSWDFGDGSPVDNTSINPIHTYTAGGSYIVTLTVTNNEGCSAEFKKTITISGKPLANFSFNNACADSTVFFKDASTGGTITGWNWDLGNGFTSTNQNPSQVYSSLVNGMKDIPVNLVVTTQEGCVSDPVQAKLLTIYANPVADFIQAGACTGTTYAFTDKSKFNGSDAGLNGTIASYIWDFGGGTISTDKDPSLVLNAATNTSLILEVTSSNGCKGKKGPVPVISALLPTPDFTQQVICESVNAQFDDLSVMGDGTTIKSWLWDFGNGNTAGTKTTTTSFNAAGTVDVTLTVTAQNGCSNSITKPVTVNALPVAVIAPLAGALCANKPVQFTDASSGNIQGWLWTFDNATTSVLQKPEGVFTAGNHNVSLSIKNNIGCESKVVNAVFVVNAKPQISFDFKDGCKNQSVQFSGINNSAAMIEQWNWSFGDNMYSSVKDPQHTYKKNGAYPVRLFAVESSGCYSDTLTKLINIYGTDANAGQDVYATFNQPVQLHATGGLSYEWSPANGLSNVNIADPVATITNDQTYSVKALTPEGCESYDEITIKIYVGPEIYVPKAFTPDGNGNNDVLKAIPVATIQFEEFSIYNRLGQLVFRTNDYTKGWDGTYKGEAQNTGAYIWVASATDYKGNKLFRKGTVVLIR